MNMEPRINTENLVVALGDLRFTVERDWGILPEDQNFGFISQVSVDSVGRVFVFQRGDVPILVFEPNGQFCSAWGHGQIADAHGIFISSKDQVFLVDRDAHQILKFTADGILIDILGDRHKPQFQAPFNHPASVAVSADGDIYVADGYGNSVIHRFSTTGQLVQTWGRPGSGEGEFSTPHSICLDHQNRVLVADRENNRVQIFDREGRYISQWTDFYHPMDIFEHKKGEFLITDQTPRLSRMSSDGELLGRCRPVLNMPHGVSGNKAGDIFIAEMNPSRITKLACLL